MDAATLRKIQLLTNITRHTEIRVLIDSLGNETQYVCTGAKEVRKRRGYSRNCLDRWIGNYPTIIGLAHPENTFQLVKGYVLLKLTDVGVHRSNVLSIKKDEGLLRIKANC